MAKNRANDANRVFTNPISHVRVLPNQRNHVYADESGMRGFGAFDKPLTKTRGSVETVETDSKSSKAPRQVYKAFAAVGTSGTSETYGDPSVGAKGYGSASALTANKARQKAYNKASDEKMKSTTKVSESISYMDRPEAKKKKTGTVKINTNPVKDSD